MRRKVFDKLASVGGVVLVIVLAVAGARCCSATASPTTTCTLSSLSNRSRSLRRRRSSTRTGKEITPSMIPSVSQYAGQQLLTGQQAEAYANDFINVHLREIGGGKTYSELSVVAMALPKGSAAYTEAEAKVQTVFQGTTLRGLLLEAYGFSLIAEIAFWCAIAAFALAGIMAVLVGFGFAHARRTNKDEELMPSHAPHGALVSA